MNGLATLHEEKMTRFRAAECVAEVTSKPWGTMTVETRTQVRSRLQRLLHGERVISRPPSHPLQSSPPSSKSMFYYITYSSPLRHASSMFVSSLLVFYVFCLFLLFTASYQFRKVFERMCSSMLIFAWVFF